MIAAENGALPGGKVGGLGDVVRDVPAALARAGHTVAVLTPGYGSLSRLPGAHRVTGLRVDFGGRPQLVTLFRVEAKAPVSGVVHWVLEHPLFSACGDGAIYCTADAEPFAMDASKFALFCHAACQVLSAGALPRPDVIHLHDWHSAALLLLRQSLPEYRALAAIPTVYSIHNLAIQGVRPLKNNASSLATWFPGLSADTGLIADPAHTDCINFMRAGINLADRVHTVSPTYAREILMSSDPELGFFGGEGLERDLQKVHADGRLAGILNGCEYPRGKARPGSRKAFIEFAATVLMRWIGGGIHVSAAHYLAGERLRQWPKRRDGGLVVASVGRLTAQKVSLLTRATAPGVTALDSLLLNAGTAMYLMLGTGDADYEDAMVDHMSRHANFIFLSGFDDELADRIYRFCDLFLMPSSFEPCGISQMLAMRAGKPCLVHAVGGLADTVEHGRNGFAFGGDTPAAQVRQMLETYHQALHIHTDQPEQWQLMSRAAAAARFSWDDSVRAYEEKLYAPLS